MNKSRFFCSVALVFMVAVFTAVNPVILYAELERMPCILDEEYDFDNASEYEYYDEQEVRPDVTAEVTLEALFNPMPEPATERGRSPRIYRLGRGISFHMCWCWGIRVLTYDSEEDFNGWQYDRFTFWQDSETRSIIITDNREFVAFFDYERDIASTLAYDGTRSHRFRTFSVYFFSNGNAVLVQANPLPNFNFRTNWAWQWRYFTDERMPVSLNFIMELDDRFMQLIGHNFFELGAWNR